MENKESNQKTSKPVSLLLLIPALLFGIISISLAVVGLGLIPIIPAIIGILLGGLSLLLFKKSFKVFTWIVLGISIIAALISIVRGTLIENKVAADVTFDSTIVKVQEGIDVDFQDAFSETDTGASADSIP